MFTCSYNGEDMNSNPFTLYDATPEIEAMQQYPPNADGSFYITQSQPSSTTLPGGTGRPQCYADNAAQIVWKTSMPNNVRTDAGGAYLNAPAFLFIRQRNPSDPAIVQIQC
jgi:hypothetical protein